jgi:hypothetical protein
MRSMRSIVGASIISAAVMFAAAVGMPASGATSIPRGAAQPGLESCAFHTVVKPVNFTITCADGYTVLSATRWTTWSASRAVGTTTFGLNFCVPNCAASRITYFPKSTVRLSAPKKTVDGLLFTRLSVGYVLHGANKSYGITFVYNKANEN